MRGVIFNDWSQAKQMQTPELLHSEIPDEQPTQFEMADETQPTAKPDKKSIIPWL